MFNKDIVIASNNKHKIQEFKEILTNYQIVSLEEIGFTDDIVEDGHSFQENALIKTHAVQEYLKQQGKEMIVVADDSGLCCKGLDGAPGIYSARYAGEHDSQANRDKLRKELKGKDHDAYFVCCIALEYPDGTCQTFEGRTEGTIIEEERGDTGFGYDSIFLSKDLGKTFGEGTQEEKNRVSHRRRAIEKLKEVL